MLFSKEDDEEDAEPHCKKNLSLEFPTRYDTNQPGQLQQQAIVLKFQIMILRDYMSGIIREAILSSPEPKAHR